MSSDREDRAAGDSPAVAKNATVDAIVAAIIFIIGAVVVFEARRLGATWTSDGPGAGYFPFYIGLILCVSSLGILYQATVGKGRDTDAFVDRVQLRRVASVLLPATVYVFAIWLLGIYVASAVYVALFMIILGKYQPVRSVVLGIVINAFFFVMFEVWFKVPLYKGVLDPLRFLGY
ncbi:MAG: tripartite tricarboxylate transporter TctB family protein [Aquincola sp.]|nr:tripartite tricarboxylate transporter TctB family protein [Aquincola sp.]MDH5331765.1 tripartite tricarboxylate transporter TctB family protein [Aquincola sp.]